MTAAAVKKPKSEKRYVYLRARPDGSLVANDPYSSSALTRLKIKPNDLLKANLKKEADERDSAQWRKAHALGTFLALNLDDFAQFHHGFHKGKAQIDSHGALKLLQGMSGVECDSYSIVDADGVCSMVHVPRSMAYDSMPESQFQAAYTGFCAFLRTRYWHDMDEHAIEEAARFAGMASP